MSPSSRSTRTFALVAVGGALHAAAAATLWTQFGFENLLVAFGTEPTYATYAMLGMVLAGAVPAALARWRTTAAPVLLVGVVFVLAAVGTWTTARRGLTPVGPTPFGWYVLLWPAVVGLAGLVGELAWRTRRYRPA